MENIKKILNVRVPAKASAWYIGSSVLAKGISALVTPIFTRLLTPEEYGLYPLYLSWLSVFTILISLELAGGVMYRGLQKFENNKDEFISASFGLFLCVFVVSCSLYFAFSSFINSVTRLGTFVTFLMLCTIFSNTVTGFYTAKAKYEYKYMRATLINLISSLASPLLSVALIFLSYYKSEARIIASSFVLIFIAVYALSSMLKSSKTLYQKDVWFFLLRFNLPLLPHYLALGLILRSGELVIGRAYGTEALGKYSVATSIGMALTVITGGLLSALSPWILRRIKSSENERIQDLLLLLTKGLCILTLVLLAASPELLSILTPPAFHSVLIAVFPIALSVIPIFLSNVLTSSEAYFEKSYLTALPSLISAAISILLSLLVLPKVDYRFAGVFVLISYLILAVLNTLLYKRLSGELLIKVKPTLTVFALTVLYSIPLLLFRNAILSRIVLTLPLLPIGFILAKEAYGKIKES